MVMISLRTRAAIKSMGSILLVRCIQRYSTSKCIIFVQPILISRPFPIHTNFVFFFSIIEPQLSLLLQIWKVMNNHFINLDFLFFSSCKFFLFLNCNHSLSALQLTLSTFNFLIYLPNQENIPLPTTQVISPIQPMSLLDQLEAHMNCTQLFFSSSPSFIL